MAQGMLMLNSAGRDREKAYISVAWHADIRLEGSLIPAACVRR